MTDSQLMRRTFDLNTRLLLSALDGVDEATVLRRPAKDTNHIAFLACHLIDARHYLAGLLGLELESPLPPEMKDARKLDDIERFPTLPQITAAWTALAAPIGERLAAASEAALEEAVSQAFPIEGGDRLRGGAAFLLDHEAFHIGQIALLRRIYGLPAMSWA